MGRDVGMYGLNANLMREIRLKSAENESILEVSLESGLHRAVNLWNKSGTCPVDNSVDEVFWEKMGNSCASKSFTTCSVYVLSFVNLC